MNFPFQSDGIHTSNLIAESVDGVMVPATRQNAGKSAAATIGSAPRGPAAPNGRGGANVPGDTDCARVMVASGSANDARLAHDRGPNTPVWLSADAARTKPPLADTGMDCCGWRDAASATTPPTIMMDTLIDVIPGPFLGPVLARRRD